MPPSSVATAIAVESTTATTTKRVLSTKGDAEQSTSAPPANTDEHDHFFWTYTEEPHRTRRQAIIKAHPEVLKLCGPEPLTKWVVLGVVSLQILCAVLLKNTPFFSWTFFLTAYIIGATANQNLFLAIHEISHNLAFKSGMANRLIAIFANLPIGIPYSASFRPYHLTHHKSLGVDGLDTDLPTKFEAIFLNNIAGKSFFCTFQILFYALRPMFVYRVPITNIHLLNIAVQILFDIILVKYLGSGQSLKYLILSSFLAGSLHPCAGHFIAEHYVFNPPAAGSDDGRPAGRTPTGQRLPVSLDPSVPLPETYSYYGPLNFFTYNVGLHNEHHDFPAIPWTRLPALYATAREFYDPLPRHDSWVRVIWQFILDPSVGMWCRVKRKEGGRKVGAGAGGGGWKTEELGSGEGGEPIAGVL